MSCEWQMAIKRSNVYLFPRNPLYSHGWQIQCSCGLTIKVRWGWLHPPTLSRTLLIPFKSCNSPLHFRRALLSQTPIHLPIFNLVPRLSFLSTFFSLQFWLGFPFHTKYSSAQTLFALVSFPFFSLLGVAC